MGHTARLCNVTSEMLHLVVSDNRTICSFSYPLMPLMTMPWTK